MRLNFRAPWACCTICRAHLALNHDAALCAQISDYLSWLAQVKERTGG